VYHGGLRLDVGFQEVSTKLHLLAGLEGGHAEVRASGAAEGVAQIALFK